MKFPHEFHSFIRICGMFQTLTQNYNIFFLNTYECFSNKFHTNKLYTTKYII